MDPRRFIEELRCTPYDAVVSFSPFFGNVTLNDGVSLFDELGVKFVGWQLDHPIYAPHSLDRCLKRRYAIYSNHNHLKFAQAIRLPGKGRVMLPGAAPLDVNLKDYRSREWSIFVAATFNGEPKPLWENIENSPAKKLLIGVIDQLQSDREASLIQAFSQTSKKKKLNVRLGESSTLDDEMIIFLREPLTHFRNLDRINIIRSLAHFSLPITICGKGWRDYLGERANVIYLDAPVDFKDLPKLYNNSKVVLNLNAGNGGCERAIYAAMAGAAILSDFSDDLSRLFANQDERAFFNRAKLGHVVEAASRLLESEKGEQIARHGHERIMESGLWSHRAEQIVQYLTQ